MSSEERSQAAARPRRDAPDTDDAFRRLARLPEGPQREALRHEIVQAWLPVSERVSRRFRNRGEHAADLRQVAALALVKAVDRYDPHRGFAFESFAIPTITGEIKRHFRDHVRSLHIPRRLQELRSTVRTAETQLVQELGGRSPTVSELAAATGLTEAEVRMGVEAEAAYNTLTLDAPLPGLEDCLFAETVGGPDPWLELVVDLQSLRPLLSALPERERHVLYLRFYGGLSQQQIGASLGVSQMHISRILSRTFAQLRDDMLAPA